MAGLIKGYNKIKPRDIRNKEYNKEGVYFVKQSKTFVVRVKNPSNSTKKLCPFVSLFQCKTKQEAEQKLQEYLNLKKPTP